VVVCAYSVVSNDIYSLLHIHILLALPIVLRTFPNFRLHIQASVYRPQNIFLDPIHRSTHTLDSYRDHARATDGLYTKETLIRPFTGVVIDF